MNEPKIMWKFSAGGYCGVFMPRHVMQKLARLQAKHEESVRALLTEHAGELEPEDWTINKDWQQVGKQVVTHYPCRTFSVEERIRRFTPQQPERVEVWPDRETAEEMASQEAQDVRREAG